jgi:putative sigma-54 modulation protein
MQLHFTGRNVEVTPALKTFTQEKFQRLERHHANIGQVSVVFQIEHLTHIAEATVHLSGTEIHATAKTDDMYSAIDELIDKLVAQLTKHKEKAGHH